MTGEWVRQIAKQLGVTHYTTQQTIARLRAASIERKKRFKAEAPERKKQRALRTRERRAARAKLIHDLRASGLSLEEVAKRLGYKSWRSLGSVIRNLRLVLPELLPILPRPGRWRKVPTDKDRARVKYLASFLRRDIQNPELAEELGVPVNTLRNEIRRLRHLFPGVLPLRVGGRVARPAAKRT